MEKKELFKKISEEVIDGNINKVQKLIHETLEKKIKPKEIINEALIEGMKEVGIRFKEFKIFVPEVLMSAKAMSAGMDILKPMLVEGDMPSKGKCVFATVEGDVHDIGKKLVSMMMESDGYEIIDLGTNVPTQIIINAVIEHKPELVAMSAMLTTTMKPMEITVKALKENNLYDNIKIMVGGAPLTKRFADQIGAYYANDASSAVELANLLTQSDTKNM